jgi:hypothetical protein
MRNVLNFVAAKRETDTMDTFIDSLGISCFTDAKMML